MTIYQHQSTSDQGSSPMIGEQLGAARKKAPIRKASTDRE